MYNFRKAEEEAVTDANANENHRHLSWERTVPIEGRRVREAPLARLGGGLWV